MTMEKTAARPANWKELRDRLSSLVAGRVVYLQKQYCPNQTPSSKAALAQLRRAASDDKGWRGLTVDAFSVDFHTYVPAYMYPLNRAGRERRLGDEPTEAEIAVRSAVILYAIHQQSRREPMHGNNSPGAAIARLAWADNVSEDSVRRRFAALITAESQSEFSHHLRTMVRMLRDHSIPMDYGRLTYDLFTWQHRTSRGSVRLWWSRDFENDITPPKTKNDTKGDNQS